MGGCRREDHVDRDPAHGRIRQRALGPRPHRCRRDRPRRNLLRRRRRRGPDPRHALPDACSAAIRCTSRRSIATCSTCRWRSPRPASNIAPPRPSTSRCGTCSARSATSRCIRCSAASAATGSASTTPAPAIRYVRSTNIKPVSNWNLGESDGPYEDLDGFMNRADALAESLLESGITRHEDLAVRSGGAGEQRPVHHRPHR